MSCRSAGEWRLFSWSRNRGFHFWGKYSTLYTAMKPKTRKKIDQALATVCLNCPVCRRARDEQKGVAFWLTSSVEGRFCPFCRAYERVYRRKAHEPLANARLRTASEPPPRKAARAAAMQTPPREHPRRPEEHPNSQTDAGPRPSIGSGRKYLSNIL
jgi:hypothetical protein